MKTVWSEISLKLSQIVDNAQYKVWIAPIKGAFADGELTLLARNEFVAKFVRSHYQDVISQASAAVLGEAPNIVIKAEPAGSGACALQAEVCHDSNAPHSETSWAGTAGRGESGGHKIIGSEYAVGVGRGAGLEPEIAGSQGLAAGSPRGCNAEQGHLPLGWDAGDVYGGARSHRLIKAWRHSFDDFVVGPCNELAHAAARSVCEHHTGFGSVLFLCSEAGLGKTHLMQAVGHNLIRASNFRAPRIEYLTAEEFAGQMRLSLKSGDIDRFKVRFREADVLLLEDVHFLQEKEKTQNEVMATITALLNKGSKVVFSSSFAPRDLRKMDGQLLSRLSSGMIGCIQRPDRETRRRIITSKASVHQVALPEDVADYLADTMSADIRQIESCIQNLALKARFFNQAITMDMARETVCNYLDSIAMVNLPEIIRMVCQGFGVSEDSLNSKSRKQEYVQARNTAFYLARKHTSLSLQEIGKHFNRAHSTVIKGITSLEREISRQSHTGRQLAGTISLIEKKAKLSDADA